MTGAVTGKVCNLFGGDAVRSADGRTDVDSKRTPDESCDAEFRKAFPERYIELGIAETNSVSLASGLASCGFVPYIFSMAPFGVLKTAEQLRTDADYNHLPVRLVGRLAGLAACASAVLNNGLGRYDAARDAAREIFERDDMAFGSLIVAELAWKAQFLRHMYFRQDDFHDLDLAIQSPFSWRYVTFIGAGHFRPGDCGIQEGHRVRPHLRAGVLQLRILLAEGGGL